MSKKFKQDISIGGNLKSLRLRSGLSQEQVSARLHTLGLPVSREILSQMELGRYSIRVSVLYALKDIYNATFEEFFVDSSSSTK